MPDLPDHEAFARHVGETFVVRPPDVAPVEVELLEAQTLAPPGDPGASARRTPFSLLFRARGAPAMPQHTYRVEHGVLGELDLFLVPIGPDAEGMRFEAVFN